MADYLGQQLGKYRLTQLLGTGGFAEVYLGEHIHLGTEAAIKLLHTQLATEAEVEKFRQEARTIGKLTHPNIVRVLDFDVQDGTPYLVMDYAPNGSLRQRIPTGQPLAPADILPYLTQVASALQYAHDQKLVHRDIKPENMLLGRRNEVLLSDFGIATVAQSTTSQKTEGVAGTAAYMAPEQIQGKPRPASDLYSLGVIVYEWLAGERPFQGTFTEVASQHLFAAPPPLRDKLPGLSPLIEQVVLTALAKDPKERFGSVQAFANAFGQASGANLTHTSFSTRAALPAMPQTGTPGITVTAASQITPHVTPQITPQTSVAAPGTPAGIPVSVASAASVLPPAQPNNQMGPSVLDSPTQLLLPTALTAQPPRSTGPYPAVSPATNMGTEATMGGAPGSATYLPPGWAAGQGAPRGNPSGYSGDSRLLAGALPPVAPGVGQGGKPHKGLRVALIVLAAVVALALVGTGTAYALPLLLHSSTGQPGSSGATVTITPKSSDLKNDFNITGISSPDASQHQVAARVVSVTTTPVTQTVNASGRTTTAATSASGSLLFWTNFEMNYPAGSVFTSSSGVTIAIDSAVSLTDSSTYVGAYAVNPGASGNIAAGDMNQGSNGVFSCPVGASQFAPETPQSGSTNVICNPQPFSGGRDSAASAVVLQSDIDNAANTLIQNNQPNAQQVLQSQLQSNERLTGSPQCQPTTSADHNAGDVANQVTVTVTFTCTGPAYDYDGALTMAAGLLTAQSETAPGAGYVLVGQIKKTLVSATPTDQGTITIVVTTEGVWAYQFSDSQKQALLSLIEGKSKQEAVSLLAAQTGIAQVSIAIGGNGQTLPTSASDMTLTVKPVPGL